MYDILIIGGGVVGCAIARELSKYQLNIALIEKSDDVACGASKANSGIVHAGYDAMPGTKKALFNIRGSKMYPSLAKELGVSFENIGSLVLAERGGIHHLEELQERGRKNGVHTHIIDRKRALELQQNLADGIMAALYAPTASIVSPYEMTIALAEQAAINGVKFFFETPAESIMIENDGYTIKAGDNVFGTKVLINAAGAGAGKIHKMCTGEELKEQFVRGDYIVLDSMERRNYTITCFPLPNELGKGCLVSPTADGNVIVGPTAIPVEDGEDTCTTPEGLSYIKLHAARIVKNINYKNTIRVFSGMRATVGEDFVIQRNGNFISLAGICSPGLTAAPAIAEHVVNDLIKETGLALNEKSEFKPRKIPYVTKKMSKQEWSELIKKDKNYSKIVCRCEKVTEGEIIQALNSPLIPRSLDALKRRVRAGMGRCQGGFCTIRIMEIMSEQLGIPFESITKKGKGSEIVSACIKEKN